MRDDEAKKIRNEMKAAGEVVFKALQETTDALCKQIDALKARSKEQDEEIADLYAKLAEQSVDQKLLANPDIAKFVSRRSAA